MTVATSYQFNLIKNLTLPEGPSNAIYDAVGLSNGGLAVFSNNNSAGVYSKLDVFTPTFGDGGGAINPALLLPRGIAQLSNGNFALAGYDGSTYYRYAVVTKTGAPVKATTDIIDAQTESTPSFFADVAALKGGGFVIVSQDATDFDLSEIDIRIFNNQGGLTGALTLTNNSGHPDDRYPQVAALDGGGFAVMWTQSYVDFFANTIRYNVWTAVIDANGALIQKPKIVDTDAFGTAIAPMNGGGYAILFEKPQTLLEFEHLELATLDATGGLIGVTNVTSPNPKTPLYYFGFGLERLSNGFLTAAYSQETMPSDRENIMALIDPATGNVVATETGGTVTGFGVGRVATFAADTVSPFNVIGAAWQGQRTSIGDAANDSIVGDDFVDIMQGGDGNDTLDGKGNNDTLDGGIGDDQLLGGAGNDVLDGGDNNDMLDGGAGADTLRGGFGDDAMAGGGGNDRLFGNDGDDQMNGDAGNDQLFGAIGNDTVDGGAGNDTLNGGDGDDVLTDASGKDRFEFNITGDNDTIIGFTPGVGAGDVIRLLGFGKAFDTFAEVLAAASDVGGDTVIDFGNGDTITIVGVTMAQLAADDFLFR